jgi:hypothetical protein
MADNDALEELLEMAGEDKFSTLEELRDAVEHNENILTVPMWKVRDAYGAQRLKVHIRSGIHNELEGLGLAHMPATIPDDQNAILRVIKKGTPAAKLIAAARRVSADHPDDDQLIRDAVSGDAKTTLQEIREIVCA